MDERRLSKRACDRCHAVKEKCRWIGGQDICDRCQRLRQLCQSLRPIAKAGRKPRYRLSTSRSGHVENPNRCVGSTSTSPSEISRALTPSPASARHEWMPLSRNLHVFVDLDDRELQFLRGISHGQTRIDQFIVGPSFRKAHQEAFLRHLCTAKLLIQDALIASSALIACENEDNPRHQDRIIGYNRAASAVSSLRTLTSFEPGALSAVLMLAISAVTFSLHISGSALSICRHSLHLIKPMYESSPQFDEDCLAFLICLVHSELAECLIRGERPTIRLDKVVQEPVVDRFLGIAFPMLAYLHDICDISCKLRSSNDTNRPDITNALDATEAAVEHWKPNLPEDFNVRYSKAEVVSMLAQANVYRSSINLLCHRLRHPYGTERSKGTDLSENILEELSSTIRLTQRSIPCVTIAFMVACFEITDRKSRAMALAQIPVVVEFSRRLQLQIKRTLEVFWGIADQHYPLYWFDVPSWLSKT